MPALWSSGGLRCCLCLRNQVFAADPCSSDFDLVQLATAGSSSSASASPASFGVSVHPACLRSSSGLGGGCCDHTTEQVLAEARRCATNKCSYCERPGASVHCQQDGCGLSLHYPCLVLHGKLGRRKKKAATYLCKDHAAKLKAQTTAKKGSVLATVRNDKSYRKNPGSKRARPNKFKNRQKQAKLPLSASPPLVCLASSSAEKGTDFKCNAVRCRCPFGEFFSDVDFWPITKCIACSSKSAHRFCVRKLTHRRGVWTCNQCVLRGPKLCLLKKSKVNFMNAFDLKSPKKRVASAKKLQKTGISVNSPKVSPESQRNPSAIFSSMKMSFCRVIDSHLGNGNGELYSKGQALPKRRTDRSPLSLRQKESPGKMSSKNVKASSPVQSEKVEISTNGKENYQKRENPPSRFTNGEVVKDAWILRRDLKDRPNSLDENPPLPVTLPITPPRNIAALSDPVESLPKGRRWTLGSPVKRLPKGWSYIIEDPLLNKYSERALSQIPESTPSSGRSARASKIRAKEAFMTSPSYKSKSCTNSPKCSPISSVSVTPVKATTPKSSPPGSASKKNSSKNCSGSSSPAKKFVDNSAVVDHGALVRKLDQAFEQAKKKKKKKVQSVKKPMIFSPLPPTIARVPHGKKEKPRKVSAEFIPIEKRLLYHIRTTLPMDSGEVEAEEDYQWLVGMSDRMIDDFLDLNNGEKTFFKLWNAHLHRYPCYGDQMMLKILTLFVEECGELIARERLYRNFLVHLASLHDFEVLDQDAVIHFTDQMRMKCRQVLFGAKSRESTKLESIARSARSEVIDFEMRQESRGGDAENASSKSATEERTECESTYLKAQSQHSPNMSYTKGNSSFSPTTRLLTRGRGRLTQPMSVPCPPSPCGSRQSSERSMKLYLSESEDENEEDEEKTSYKIGRKGDGSTPAKRAKSRSYNTAVSYAGDKSVDRISDNGTVTLGLCFSGTRRSAFASKVVLYPGRGRKRRREEDGKKTGCALKNGIGMGEITNATKEHDGKTDGDAERLKRVSSRRGRPQRQRLLEEVSSGECGGHDGDGRKKIQNKIGMSHSAPVSPKKSPHKHGKRTTRFSL